MSEVPGKHEAARCVSFEREGAEHSIRGHVEFEAVSESDLAMGEGNGDAAAGEIAVKAPASIHSTEVPRERDVAVARSGEMSGGNFEAGGGAGSEFLDGWAVDGEGVAFIDDARVVAELFRSAVVVEEAI